MIETLNKIPTYVSVLIILTDLVVAVALWLGITRSAKRLDLPDRTQRAIAFLAALLPALWLLLAPTLATILDSYLPPLRSGAPHIGMPFLILTPIAFGLLLLRLPLWRRLLEATPQHWLLGIQVYRVVGAVFFPLMALGVLPAYFAIPAGYGDLISGLPAPLVAYWVWKRGYGWRNLAILLNIVGLLDFIVAVGIGSGILHSDLSRILFDEAVTVTQPFTYVPLSLIALFVVPIGIVLHLYSLIGLFSPERTATAPDRPAAQEMQ